MATTPSTIDFPIYTRVGEKEIKLGSISVPVTYRLQKPHMNSAELEAIISVGYRREAGEE